MTSSINKVLIIGNLGRAPELRYTPAGKAVATLSVATSSRRKNKQSGEWEDETQWHRVTVLGDSAEWAASKLDKGRTVYIEGGLRYGSFENQGVRIPTVEILATNLEVFGAKKSQGQDSGEPNKAGGQSSAPQAMGGEFADWVGEYDQA